MKAAAHQSPNCSTKTKKNKIRWKTIFNMAVGILSPCNVTRGPGMTCHWIRPNVRHIGIKLPVSTSTISPQSTCHSAPVCEILSKSDRPRQKKWRYVDFQDGRSPPSCTTSYRSSIETVALNCLVLTKSRFYISATDRQTYGQVRHIKPLSLSRATA